MTGDGPQDLGLVWGAVVPRQRGRSEGSCFLWACPTEPAGSSEPLGGERRRGTGACAYQWPPSGRREGRYQEPQDGALERVPFTALGTIGRSANHAPG